MLYVDFKAGFELPPYWLNHPTVAKAMESLDKSGDSRANAGEYKGIEAVAPVEFKLANQSDSEYWMFPIEPIVSINGKNIIVRRNVSKKDNKSNQRGSIKETWSQDDYDITIAGVFINTLDKYPKEEMQKLRMFCEAQQTIDVRCPLFTIFNITKIAIESFDFPFTKGKENQMFTIKAYSDDMYNLLIES